MPKISYKSTVTQDQDFGDFAFDILASARYFQLDHLVKFDEEARTVFFNCDASIIEMFFTKNLSKEYKFFPAHYELCERPQDDKDLPFLEARRLDLDLYEKMSQQQAKSIIPANDFLQKCDNQNIVISEYHPDPYPKTILSCLLTHKFEKKPTIVLERLPSSLNNALTDWMLGSTETPLPKAIQYYCDFIDKQNLEEALRVFPNLDIEDQTLLKSFTSKFLNEAKAKHFPVLFFESEHSRVGDIHQKVGGGRHECLVAALRVLRDENPDKHFIVFAGAYHDCEEFNHVTLSKAIEASPCFMIKKEMRKFLEDKAKKSEEPDERKIYLNIATKAKEYGAETPAPIKKGAGVTTTLKAGATIEVYNS